MHPALCPAFASLQGIGAGRAANVKNCELCARKIAEVSKTPKIVVCGPRLPTDLPACQPARVFDGCCDGRVLLQVEKSTVPVRTAEAVRRVLATNDKGVKFQVGR